MVARALDGFGRTVTPGINHKARFVFGQEERLG